MPARTAGILAFLAVASATAWTALHALHPAARVWAVFLLVVLPALAVLQARMLRDVDELPRMPVYLSSMITLAVLATLSVGAAFGAGLPPDRLGLLLPDAGEAVAWTAGTTAAGIGYVFLCKALGVRETPITLHLLPRTPRERAGFAGLSLAAGLCEELIYRGFLFGALMVATWGSAVATLVSAAAFGLVHGYQAPAGVARAAVLGVLLTAPVLATGSLLPAMAAHAAIDLLAGLVFADHLRD